VTTDEDIARWRLRSQRLVRPHASSVAEVVGHLLGVQAENPRQSEWALAARTATPARADVGALLAEGVLVRTHVLRSTWHYVLADDVGWLLDLTSPRVVATVDQQLRVLGLEGRALERASSVVVETLAAQPDSTRAELAVALQEAGVETGGQRAMLLLGWLELGQVVCSGRPREGEHTYALLADRVPSPRRLEREEALAELALRYVTGHGPATERDLAYWATVTVTDVRRGLAAVRDRLESFEHDGRTYWHLPGQRPPRGAGTPGAHLLQILDEMYRGYQDSRWVLDAAGLLAKGREATTGMALVGGQVVAGMRRTVGASEVVFDLSPHRPLSRPEVEALEQAARRYAAYLGLGSRLALP
jgi:hypothetical protein